MMYIVDRIPDSPPHLCPTELRARESFPEPAVSVNIVAAQKTIDERSCEGSPVYDGVLFPVRLIRLGRDRASS